MEMIDISALQQAVDGADTCGPNLEYDPAFQELERNLVGKPEVQYGTTITAAVPPDWKTVRRQAVELLARTRDLRVAVALARAVLALDGLPGFARALQAIEAMLTAHWDGVHPQLDAEDNNDPTLRINSLAPLTDPATVLRELHDTAFVQLPGLGPLSLRQLEYANGEVPVPAGQVALAPASIEQAFAAVPQEAVQGALAAARQAHASVSAIETLLGERVGNTQAPNLAPLLRSLARIVAAVQPHVQQETAPAQAEAAGPASMAVAAAAPVQGLSGDILDRDDVLLAIDKLLAYYQRHEPSSPVPLLLERARRLVPKTFMEVIEDLAPDGVSQLLVIRGPLPQQ
ncbi:type VI secretion system protein TssA [[Empedobacter] haloabium]|uniref:Type VI secretion system protein TssA n=1 Tax=[Empedobacter] haloabium TaxID=592317 RepID=A0ABZ1UDZ7_9BURK